MAGTLLHDIGVSVIAATGLGLVAHWCRQPLILGYLVAGMVIGPKVGWALVGDSNNVSTISDIGLILLLFVIGLEMDVRQLLRAGRQLLVAGVGQFLVCLGLGLLLFGGLGWGLGGSHADGLYVALVCGLSSTAIVVKLLYDKSELDTMAGRLTLGVLVIQDVYAILVLAFQPSFSHPSIGPVVWSLLSAGMLSGACFLISKYFLRVAFASIARAPELVVAVSIGWCAVVAGTAGVVHLSAEMGALIAGLSIAAFPYSLHVTAKTLPLRDFFLTLFFVALGMDIPVPHLAQIGAIALVVSFTVLSRFLSVYPLLVAAGAGRRTAFVVSINLAQISEFGLVIAALGLTLGHIGDDTKNLISYAMAVTAVLGTYAIRYSHPLYQLTERGLAAIGLGDKAAKTKTDDTCDHHPVAILGFHRGARALIDHLAVSDPGMLGRILVIDFNTEVLKELSKRGVAGHFGDISQVDTLVHAHLERAQVVLSTIPDMLLKGTDNASLVKSCRSIAPHAAIVATAESMEQELRLVDAGASMVLMPYAIVGQHLAGFLDATLADAH